MKKILLSLGLGLAAAVIDVLPMVIRKLDKSYIFSALFVWIALGLIIPSAELIPIGWLNGLTIALLCVLPVICLVFKLDRAAVPVMLVSAAVLGSAVGFFGKLLIKP